jgi:hypothetical protein
MNQAMDLKIAESRNAEQEKYKPFQDNVLSRRAMAF